MKSAKKGQVHVVTKSSGFKRIARGIARKSHASIGRHAVKNPKIRQRVLAVLANDIQREMKVICSRKANSVLRQTSVEALKQFSWRNLLKELEQLTPTLYAVLKSCTDVKRRQRNIGGKCTSVHAYPSSEMILGLCASILLRHRNVHMNAVQHVISLILNVGHSGKQVSLMSVYMFGLRKIIGLHKITEVATLPFTTTGTEVFRSYWRKAR